ncbi:tripartite tricarboxylate transporter substrate binding protein [Advenella mimigardefordensis]|uniref:Putative Bug-like extracytoplasmic solute binding receptor, TTT family n=1 Tax=Advenella mimigardefordensis (strain DSM 17166 / LMG 22922 / DPN7) TaxID=1247726 RepID=W0PEY0_ADVMD|nr:tripartite tricarboxylate transporter substrate binding protein [Advenella mimigardefordensis]AHG63835.1 putative Bug-like extracytoplasmic solute binding receptor, TTT family [Advenella mimigardefordensis DPN7]
MQRRQFLQACSAAAFLSASRSGLAQSGSWPEKPIRIVVPFTPGGTTDMVARLISTELARQFDQSVIVENKPGAGTVIGVDSVVKQPADGYRFVCVANSFTANKTLIKTLPYDTTGDLQPVALMGLSEHVLAAHPDTGLKNLDDLGKAARAKPGSLTYASFGNGTSAHLSGALLCQMMGIDMVHVPYKGQGPALVDLLGGQVNVMFGNWSEFRSHIENGKLVALGMATRERSRFAPNVPTLAEQGVTLESNSWQGLLARTGTPDEIVQRLNAEVNKALSAPNVVEVFAKSGVVSQAGSVAQFTEFVNSEIAKYSDIIRRANISMG